MKKFLASVAAVGLMGGAAFAQSVVLVPQGEGPGGQERFILVPVPQEDASRQRAGEPQARERAEAMALDLYSRGYRRGIADAQSAAGPTLDPSAMEQIGRELFERGYMMGLMAGRSQEVASALPGTDRRQRSADTAGQDGATAATDAGQDDGAEDPAGQSTQEQVAQATGGQATQSEAVAAEGEQVVIGSAESDEHGTYLTDDAGRAVYMLEADRQGQGDAAAQSTCDSVCAEVWPPVTSPVKPLAEDRANEEMLSTIEREGGGNQVTYNGWPLYHYSRDAGAGQATGQDVHDEWGEWYLLQPSGEPVGHE